MLVKNIKGGNQQGLNGMTITLAVGLSLCLGATRKEKYLLLLQCLDSALPSNVAVVCYWLIETRRSSWHQKCTTFLDHCTRGKVSISPFPQGLKEHITLVVKKSPAKWAKFILGWSLMLQIRAESECGKKWTHKRKNYCQQFFFLMVTIHIL